MHFSFNSFFSKNDRFTTDVSPLVCCSHLFPAPSLIFASGANAAGVTGAALSADSQHMATICEDK